jgi:hypothetical protein
MGFKCSLIFIFFSFRFFSQQNYFQQEVNYKIDVSLHDETHELSAFEKIEYINHSNTALTYIYFHLWPNAYKNNETALAKQLLSLGETTMYFAKAEELGYIDSLNFTVNGKPAKWEYDKEHIDICKVLLDEPLQSGDTITITTPFHVKLPSASISRLGHLGQAYAITQWYPKPAVFDKYGWHQMPYLNQGEFYSEFGSFDVSITLPKNYLLAATGDRIDEQEEESWLATKVAETEKMIAEKNYSYDNSFPPSSSTFKTIRFKQYRVHDFAWFADKRFHVLKGKVYLPYSGSTVDSWAFFTNNEPQLWSNALEYIHDATAFYSELNGDYPYNHVTAVDGTISAGGGMEYPNITVIGESNDAFTLETTIMHEVGHNWYYGILGSNEREFAFMDEGLNSFYEMRYIRTKYPEKTVASILGRDSTFKFFGLNKFKHKAQYEFSYLLAARKNSDQPIMTPAQYFTNYNYGAIVYSKSAITFDYLMSYVGKEKFDEAMKFYNEQWKFKHPYPEDLIKTLQYYFNTDLNWFVADMLVTKKKIDYKILKHKQFADRSHAILIKNLRKVSAPVSVSGLKDGKLVGTVWYNGIPTKTKRVIEFPPSEVDEFRIDYGEYIPEVNRKNNSMRTHGLFKKAEPLKLSFVGSIDNPHYNQLNYLPILGYNSYNKFMLGCAFYNYSFLQKQVEFTAAPMYAFGTKSPVGFAEIAWNILPRRNFIRQITLSTKAKSFAYQRYDPSYLNDAYGTHFGSQDLNYYKVAATVDVELKKKDPLSKINQHIGYTTNVLMTDRISTELKPTSIALTNALNTTIINSLYYMLENKRVINPFNAVINAQHNDRFVKLSGEINYAITFAKNNSLDIRLFAGAFAYKADNFNEDYRFRMSGYSGPQDYLYDYNYIGRNEINGVPFSQFVEGDGAFKTFTYLGQSSKWLLALNLKSPTVKKIPLRLFADIGASEFNEGMLNQRVLYDAGVNLCLWKNIFEIYVPVIYSSDIKTNLKAIGKDKFFDTIRFTLNLHNIKPHQFISGFLQ